ncbi:hypothetical protein GCM10027258_62570 [Amycolatopsis stemonae]
MYDKETERKLNRLEALRERHDELAKKADEARVELVEAILDMFPADGSRPAYGLPAEVARRSGYTREHIGVLRKEQREKRETGAAKVAQD